MEKEEKSFITYMVIGCLVFILGIWLVVWNHSNMVDTYSEACKEAKGKPMYNGRHWECLK